MKQITLRLSDGLAERPERAAGKLETSQNDLLRRALIECLKREEK
jgi:predicted transcriptional regulator